MKMISIFPFFPENTEFMAQECQRVAKTSGLQEFAVSMTLHPEGFPAMAKAELYIKAFADFQKRMQGSGLRIGILLQSLLGHGWPGTPQTQEKWQKIINFKGEETTRCCLLDKQYQNYVRTTIIGLAKENPAFFMTDDDFRLLNNDSLECFCPLHMELFKIKVTPEEVREALRNEAWNHPVIREFERVRRSSMIELARVIREAIDSIDSTIPCGCSVPGRDYLVYSEITKTLAGNTEPFVRIGNGVFCEGDPKDIFNRMRDAAIMADAVRDIRIRLDEADTYPQTLFSKSETSMLSHITIGTLQGLKGAKLWIHNLSQPIHCQNPEYEATLLKYKGYLRTIEKSVEQTSFTGVVSPLADPERNFHPLHIQRFFTERWWQPYLFDRFGIPGYYAKVNDDTSRCYALEGERPNDFTDEEISKMLSAGLLLDGTAAENLSKRGFGSLLGVQVDGVAPSFSFEMTNDGVFLPLMHSGTVRHISVTSSETQVISRLVEFPYYKAPKKNYRIVAPGATFFRNAYGGRVVVCAFPLTLKNARNNLVVPLRKQQLTELLNMLVPLPCWVRDARDFYLRTGIINEGSILVAMANFNYTTVKKMTLNLPFKPKQVQKLSPAGIWKDTNWMPVSGGIDLATTFQMTEVVVFRIRK